MAAVCPLILLSLVVYISLSSFRRVFSSSTLLKPSLRPFASYLEKSSGGLQRLVKEKIARGLWAGLVNLLHPRPLFVAFYTVQLRRLSRSKGCVDVKERRGCITIDSFLWIL